MKRLAPRLLPVFLLAFLFVLLVWPAGAGAAVPTNPTIEELVEYARNENHDTTGHPADIPGDYQLADLADLQQGTAVQLTKGYWVEYEDETKAHPKGDPTPIAMQSTVWLYDDVVLITETAEGGVTRNGDTVTLVDGQHTISTGGTIADLVNKKVFILEADGNVHTFVCGSVSGNTLTVGGDRYKNHAACYIRAFRIGGASANGSSWSHHVNTKIKLDKLECELEGDFEIDCTADGGYNPKDACYEVYVHNFVMDLNLSKITVSGESTEREIGFKIGHFEIELVPEIVGIDFTPELKASGVAKGEVIFAVEVKEGFSCTISYFPWLIVPIIIPHDFKRTEASQDFSFVNARLEGEIFTGLGWGPGLSLLGGVLEIACQYEAGVVTRGWIEFDRWDDGNHFRWHACDPGKCFQGDCHMRIGPFVVSASALGCGVKLYDFGPQKDFPPFAKFYDSETFHDHSTKSYCPHHGYRLEVDVVGSDEKQLTDALVSYPLAEEDEPFFKTMAYNVKRDQKTGKWLLFIPKTSPSKVIGDEGNKVTVTAVIKDPLNPSQELKAEKTITEKGQKDDNEEIPPDPQSLKLTIDTRIVTVTFLDPGSGAKNLPSPIKFHPSQSKGANIPDTTPELSGCYFMGWDTEKDGTGKRYAPGSFLQTDTDVDLYAQFEPIMNVYVVSFNANGGTWAPEPQMATRGMPLQLTDKPAVWEGMKFLGWSRTDDSSQVDYEPGALFLPHDEMFITLYAVWGYNPVVVLRVHYDLNGGTSKEKIADQWIRYGSTMQVTEIIPENGMYDFLGWSLDKDAGEALFIPGETAHFFEDTTLYAVWILSPPAEPVSVAYDLNGAPRQDVPETQWIKPGKWFNIPEARLSWDDYHFFAGWSLNPKAETADYYPGRPAAFLENTVLYAVWTPVCEIRFDLNGGTMDGKSGVITQLIRKGKTIRIPGPPVLKGSVFEYWKGSAYHPGDLYVVRENHTLTAVWKKVPKTGDDFPFRLWLGLTLLGAAGLLTLAATKRRSR